MDRTGIEPVHLFVNNRVLPLHYRPSVHEIYINIKTLLLEAFLCDKQVWLAMYQHSAINYQYTPII